MRKKILEEIIDTLDNNKNIKVVSFDIFDTLLFRTVLKPENVFFYMYESAPNLFHEYSNARNWMFVRREIEKKARNNKFLRSGSREVSLCEIYSYLDFLDDRKHDIMSHEINCEKNTCICNDEVYNAILFIKKKYDVEIILTSDMYLSKEQLKEILNSNGINTNIFSKIYVSNEIGYSKRNRKMWEHIISEHKIEFSCLLHIGDNLKSDVTFPRTCGIKTLYYPFMSEIDMEFPILSFEKNIFSPNYANEINYLRVIADRDTEEQYYNSWFYLGSRVLGPFFTYGIEWIVNEAKKKDIKRIFALMREGKFLSELLECSIKSNNVDIEVHPLFVSRVVVNEARLEKVVEEEIMSTVLTRGATVADIFSFYKIEDCCPDEFKEFYNEEIQELKKCSIGEKNAFDELLNFFTCHDVIGKIRLANKGNNKLLLDYLRQEKVYDRGMMLDIGWTGNTMASVCKLLNEINDNSETFAYLLYGRIDAALNNSKEFQVNAFCGEVGSKDITYRKMHLPIMELLCMCDLGTTVDYERNGNVIEPVLKKIDYPQGQMEAIKVVQEGILAFQKQFFELKKKKKVSDPYEMAGTVLHIIDRLFSYPNYKESMMLSSLVYDQNNGIDKMIPIIDKSELNQYDIEKPYKFMYSTEGKFKYPQLVYSLKNPTHYYEQVLAFNKQEKELSIVLLIKSILSLVGNEKIILVGAGVYGRKAIKYISEMGKLEQVECIVDNDISMQDITIKGIRICSIDHGFDSNNYYITPVKEDVYNSLHNQIRSAFPYARIYGLYE